MLGTGLIFRVIEFVHNVCDPLILFLGTVIETISSVRERAKIRNEENQKEIDRIYGKYRGGYIPSNNTKSDKTAEKAIKNVGKKG